MLKKLWYPAEADRFRLENDPTLLSEVLQAYCRIMQTLLTTTKTDGVSKEQLIQFKQRFGHMAYVCRFSGCRAAFGSPRALEDHELARHTGASDAQRLHAHIAALGSSLQRHSRRTSGLTITKTRKSLLGLASYGKTTSAAGVLRESSRD
jgi:hypothetical protein